MNNPVKPQRRLSELMRAGSALRPQGKCAFFRWDFDSSGDMIVTSCAMGAAYEAHAGHIPLSFQSGDYEMLHLFPILSKEVTHPVNGTKHCLQICITSLNDNGGWTREQCADFCETIEAEEASKDMAVDRFLAVRDPEPALA